VGQVECYGLGSAVADGVAAADDVADDVADGGSAIAGSVDGGSADGGSADGAVGSTRYKSLPIRCR